MRGEFFQNKDNYNENADSDPEESYSTEGEEDFKERNDLEIKKEINLNIFFNKNKKLFTKEEEDELLRQLMEAGELVDTDDDEDEISEVQQDPDPVDWSVINFTKDFIACHFLH